MSEIIRRKNHQPVYGPIGESVARRSYLKPKNLSYIHKTNSDVMEKWEDLCYRVAQGNINFLSRSVEPNEAQELYDALVDMKILLGGRHFCNTGIKGREFVGNCFVSGWNWLRIGFHFSFTFERLMEGGGVGANYSDMYFKDSPRIRPVKVMYSCSTKHKDYANMRPMLTRKKQKGVKTFVIPDSREGWTKALDMLITAFGGGYPYLLNFDFSEIRPQGSKLKRTGGAASGPEPLLRTFKTISDLLMDNVGKKFDWEMGMIIDQAIAECVMAGGCRRSARMAVKHWKDEGILDFIAIKKGGTEHWTTNISVIVDNEFLKAIDEKDEWALKVFEAVIDGMFINGEPGFAFYDNAIKGENRFYSPNACFSGDTLVAVADGRHAVDLKTLSEEGKDVPVYCVDDDGNTNISMMRNPRCTGHKDILEVTLDDGSVIHCTEDHKIRLRNKKYVEAKDLKEGQSLFVRSKTFSNKGHLMTSFKGKYHMEHRAIYGFYNPEDDLDGFDIHHLDHNKVNNSIDNLIKVTPTEHKTKYHSIEGDNNPMRKWWGGASEKEKLRYVENMSKSTSGEKNGRYLNFTNEEVKNQMISFIKSEGKPLSKPVWVKYAKEKGYIQGFTSFRGSMEEMIAEANIECGFGHIKDGFEKRAMRQYIEILKHTDLDVRLHGRHIRVHKNCEICGKELIVKWGNREISYCQPCGSRRAIKFAQEACVHATKNRRKEATDVLIETFERYVHTHNRLPNRLQFLKKLEGTNVKDFRTAGFATYGDFLEKEITKAYGVKFEVNKIGRTEGYRVKKASELKDNGFVYNHKVVNISKVGRQDVYTGTVDKYHNYCTILSNTGDKLNYSVINSLNCGEFFMEEGEFCNTGHQNLARIESDEEAKKIAKLVTRALMRANYCDLPSESREITDKNQRIGVGIMGIQNFSLKKGIKYSEIPDSEYMKDFFTELYATVRQTADGYADELGINRPIKTTTVAPTGSVGQVAGATTGCQSIIYKYYIRRMRLHIDDPQVMEYKNKGYKIEVDSNAPETGVIVCIPMKDPLLDEFPEELIEDQGDVGAEKALKLQEFLQEYWADNSISFTINFDPREVDREELGTQILKSLPKLKGTTVLPELHNYAQPPYTRITKEEYLEEISRIQDKESSETIEVQCAGGSCEIII